MSIQIKVPSLPESVADATVLEWHKKIGDYVERDESLVDLETDKVVLEVPSPDGGTLKSIEKETGAVVLGGTLLAIIEKGERVNIANKETDSSVEDSKSKTTHEDNTDKLNLSPAVRRIVSERSIDITKVTGTGKDGRILKQDVLNALDIDNTKEQQTSSNDTVELNGHRIEKRVPMSRMRAKIAERLLQSKQNTAMLTTFNEVNMKAIMKVRAKHKDAFEKKYNVKLGFMSFFSKAVCSALKEFPAVNASIDGNDIIYHGYYDIGIAVSTERGLVVPVIRNVDALSMDKIETSIIEYATKARENKISIEDMQGGTFTITNGGVFGSLISTPIINPPQTAILGMHKIEERPVVENGEIVIRPMMYVALSYDHRLIDGKDSVQFLTYIKKHLEDPLSLMLGL